MYRCQHFTIRELVTPAIFRARGERAWELLRPGSLVTLDALWERFGAFTVNDWHRGGRYEDSGLRDFTSGVGAKFSMHKFGGAFDCKFADHKPPAVAAYVLARPEEFPHITAIEDVDSTPTWFHFDDRNHDRGGIWVVKP